MLKDAGQVRSQATKTFARPAARVRGFTTISTSLPRSTRNRTSRSSENPARRPRTNADTFGWSTFSSSAAAACVNPRLVMSVPILRASSAFASASAGRPRLRPDAEQKFEATGVPDPPIARPTSTQSRWRSESRAISRPPDIGRTITQCATSLDPRSRAPAPGCGAASAQSRCRLRPVADSLLPIRALAFTHLRSRSHPLAISLSPNIQIAFEIRRPRNSLSA